MLQQTISAPNKMERIPFSVRGVAIAAASQGANLNAEKVNIAWRQALSLWSTVAPLDFHFPFASQDSLLRINFVRDGRRSQELGSASGSISRTPTGPKGGSFIEVDCDNDLFVDAFLEPDLHATMPGPADLIAVLAHEIGHGLGLDHPPVDPVTGRETEPALMSRSVGFVSRKLFPYDVREVQRLHGSIRLAQPVPARLTETAQLINASPSVTLQKVTPGLVVVGRTGDSTLVDMLVPAKGRLLNALRLKFTTVSPNVFVNRVETFDGIVPLQQFAVSERAIRGEGLVGRSVDLRLGFLRRPVLRDHMLVRMEVRFTGDFGVLQVHEVTAETLQPPQLVSQTP